MIARSVRTVLYVFAAWLAYSAFQVVVSLALAKPTDDTVWMRLLLVDLVMAIYWTAISFPIAAWHRRLRGRHREILRVLALHFPLLLLATIGDTLTTRLSMRVFSHYVPPAPFIATMTYFADYDVLSYLAVIVVADALLARAAGLREERRARHLEGLLGRARLDYLEAQLQPHFLFNALGAVSELAYEAPATALRVLRQLAHIFRTALGSRAGEVTLGEELVAIEPYLDIQRLRFPDWLQIDYDVGGDTLDCLVPRFVLQPLVENAIRHGLTGRVAAGCIEISARLEDGRLRLRVSDNGIGLRQGAGRAGYGIGLTNVRERLTTLYGSDQRLELLDAPGGGAVAELTLPARRLVDVPQPDVSPVDENFGERTGENNGAGAHAVGARPHERSLVRTAALGFGLWTIAGALWTLQSYAYLRIRGRLGQMSFRWVAGYDMTGAITWAFLSPLIFAAISRVPLERPRLAQRVALYVVGVGLLDVLHAFVLHRIFSPQTAFFAQADANTFALNLLVLAVLVAIGHRRQLAEWIRARELAADALSSELLAARERAARLQAIPPVVLNALDRAIHAVSLDPSPSHAEQLLARLADYLRVAIECSDDEGLTESREQSLARSLARFERLTISPSTLTPS